MSRWSPYDNNGGTCVAVAGKDFCIVAADTRLSTGYNILSRDSSKLIKLSDSCVMATAGFHGDRTTLWKVLRARQVVYQQQHGHPMSCPAMAQLLSTTLYYKRFFPYYTFNILAGLDANGRGCVYGYDAIGSFERSGYTAQGSAQELLMPVLDNQLKAESPLLIPSRPTETQLTQDEAVDLVKDVFASAAERDIYTGDAAEILIITSAGVRREVIPLKRD